MPQVMSPPSPKITSRNLSYSSELPPFLAALHAQASGASLDAPSAAQRRSAKKRSSSEEAEDAPLVVDERGNALSVQVDRDGVIRDAPAAGDGADADADKPEKRQDEAKTVIGGRKRKAGKVVHGASDARHTGQPDANNKDDKLPEAPAANKAKKAAKKIKLSFDEDEG